MSSRRQKRPVSLNVSHPPGSQARSRTRRRVRSPSIARQQKGDSLAQHDWNSPAHALQKCRSNNPLVLWCYRHQLDYTLYIIAAVLVGALVFSVPICLQMILPSEAVTDPANPANVLYAKSHADILLVSFYVVIWTFLRALVTKCVLLPLAARCCAPKDFDRFCEQGWLAIYYTFSFSTGLELFRISPYWNDSAYVWIDYPHVLLSGVFKTYYLAQFAFWLQQLFIIQIEKPRKDYWMFVVHHVVTCAIILVSLVANYTRFGHIVFVAMDVADIFLSLTKCLLYAGLKSVSECCFLLFFLVWLATRHGVFLWLMYIVIYEVDKHLDIGRWDPAAGYFASEGLRTFVLSMLAILQGLMVYWLFLIMRIIYRAIFSKKLEDNRSDDEESD